MPRNQWDLFRDLPGGLPQLKKLSEECRNLGSATLYLLQSLG